MPPSTSKPGFNLFNFAIGFSGIASALAVGVYAYLGTFSRHLADDYCSVGFVRTNFFAALWQNYLTVSDRFSNFMLIALSESISPRSVAALPALMLILWVAGLAWLLKENLRNLRISSGPISLLLWTLALLLVFLALLQAPNRYQTLYWRSSMATHLAPLVLMPYFAAFLLRSISRAREARISGWLYPVVFLLAFLLGGFSEPTDLIMVLLLALGIFAAWMWMKPPGRKAAMGLLIVSFAGALLALIVMIIAPANSLRLGDPPPAFPILIERSFRFALDFILDSFRTLPLPTLFSLGMPLIIFFGLHASPAPELTQSQRKRVLLGMALVPVISYLLIVVSFAPSVYGQSFPVERARFAGQFILVAALMIEGAALGMLLAQRRPRSLPLSSFPLSILAALLLLLAAIYPLRAAWLTLADVPEYHARAQAWDERQALIFSLKAQGETDLIVPGADGVHGIKEVDFNPQHWVNRCAAEYYNVNSIQAIQIKNP